MATDKIAAQPRVRRSKRKGRKTALWKDVRRSIAHSKGRFTSIVLLMALGSFALVGLYVTGPDMRATGQAYFGRYSLADLTVMSDYGLDEKDEAALAGASGTAAVEYGYFKDVTVGGSTDALRIMSAPEDVSTFELVDGRMPEKAGEICVDTNLGQDYAIGSTVTVEEKPNALNDACVLRDTTYTVVGHVHTPEIISIVNMGQSTAGTGSLKGYGVVAADEFDSDVYMTVRMSFADTAEMDPYSNEYRDAVAAHKAEVEGLIAERPAERLADVKSDAQAEIDDGQAEVDDAKQQLADAKQELDDAAQTLADASVQLDDGQAQIDEAEAQITDGEAQIADGQAQIDASQETFDAAADTIASGEAELASKAGDLAAAESKLESAKARLDEGKATLDAAAPQVEAARAQIPAAKEELAAKQAEYDEASARIADAEAQVGAFDAAVAEVQQKTAELDAAQAQVEAAQAELDAKRSALDAQTEAAEAARALLAKIDAGDDEVTGKYTEEQARAMREQVAAYDAAKEQLDAAAVQIEANQAQVTAGREQLAAAQAELDGKSAAVEEARTKTIPEGKAQLAAAKEQLDTAAAQIDAAEQQVATYDAGLATYQQNLAAYAERLETYKEGRASWEAAAAQLESGRAEYASGAAALAEARQTLASKIEELASARAQVAEAKQTLAQKLSEYNEGLVEYADGQAAYEKALPEATQKIADGEADLAAARERVAKLSTPAYETDTRREALGSDAYRTYASVSEIVDSLAKVFPVLLYLVAAFVTLSTMTRMVEEERINSGTLKALGYQDGDVALKFVLYGSLAGGTGAVLGIALGHTLLPYIAYSAYGSKFTLPPIQLGFYPGITAVALVLAALCSVLPAALSVRRELAEKPAALLLPKPPRGGSKIFLERIRPVWRRLSFTHKVTARNLFRYKQRMFMTVLGVAGAVCMLVAGFGVQRSIQTMGERQFGSLLLYDMIPVQTSTATDAQLAELDELLESDDVAAHEPLLYESVNLTAGNNGDAQDINLLVPEDASQLDTYLNLRERASGQKLALGETDAVISERLSQLLGVGVGDTVSFKAADGTERSVTVTGVAEMYMGHFLVMSRAAYEACYGTAYEANAALVTLKDGSLSSVESKACEFMELSAVKSVVQNTALESQVETVVSSLDKIMAILIVVAGMLAVVIMYNLTNLNVSERMRELSTIKVLGFHSNETTMYIYRETILLTILGVLAGYVLGVGLHEYILNVVPPDNVMFNPEVAPIEFIVPSVVIAAITVVLYFVELRRLSTVDMLEALKSVE
ncbi:FtsX-like permease family protein [Paratractidigestivibacter sp.]|uniref:FtsX-like permease family protein n=1 Tax=Paratractidigestivibacter sp. TaxID=2847316 RepID=UPI002AC8DAB5|nr:FtsX-like permease family protein [Paratractidigestivibacter sp.]